jgi:exonuclease VII small subunit
VTSAQRRRYLENQRAEVENKRAIVENKMISASTVELEEWGHELARLETRLRDIDAELGIQPVGDAQTIAYRRAVDQLGQWSGNLQARMHNLEQIVAKVERAVEAVDQRLEHWIDSEAEERRARQEQLDGALDEMRTLMRTSSAERRHNQTRIYWMIASLLALQIVIALGLYWFR